MPRTRDPVVSESREMIRAGSKSFAGAARLLSRGTRESVYQLYAWCRYCDDCIDLQDLGRGAPTAEISEARGRLERLRRETTRALGGETVSEPVFVALQRVVERHEIPHHHPFELLEGFAMDVDERQYHTLDDLLSYCYHVAGVVGVMMAYVMGAEGKDTLDRAADLGIALQLTNIARDVMDDASAGRVYLPRTWLVEAGVPVEEIEQRRHRRAVPEVVQPSDFLMVPGGQRVFVSKPRKLLRVAAAGLETLILAGLRPNGKRYSREGLWNRPDPDSDA